MECPICFEYKHDIYTCDICEERICKDCKKAWKKDCPYCRARYIATAVVPNTDIEQPPPSQPLLLNYIRGPVVERRWEIRQIAGCVILGGVVTWWAFYQ